MELFPVISVNKDVTIISDSKCEFLSWEGTLEEYLHYLTASPRAAATSYGEPQGTQDVKTHRILPLIQVAKMHILV